MFNLVATEFLTNQHQLENPSKGKNVLKTLRFHEGALKQQVCSVLPRDPILNLYLGIP